VLGAGALLGLDAVLAGCRAGRAGPAPSTAAASPSPGPSPGSSVPPSAAGPVGSATDLLDDAGTCTLTPATIAGPTWFDAGLVRSDVRDGKPGVPLALALRVVRAVGCAPVAGAVVDLWQADAGGVYSGFAAAGPGQGGRPDGRDEYGQPQARATDPGRALRGTQPTGADGVVRFTTLYPGWYPTRTPHLHVEVHVDASTLLTTQLFFDDAVSDAVYAADAAYRQHGTRDTRNDTDAFWSRPAQLHLAPGGTGWLGALVLAVP